MFHFLVSICPALVQLIGCSSGEYVGNSSVTYSSLLSINDVWLLIAECIDIILFVFLLIVFEKKTKSKSWHLTKQLFRSLFTFKVVDDCVHVLPVILKCASGSEPSFVASKLSLYVSPIIRGIVLVTGVR